MNPESLPLRDLHLPDPVDWWPLAPGWWVLILLAVATLVWLVMKFRQHRRRSAARRHAMKQLRHYASDYQQHGNAVLLGSQLSELMRRTMLAYAPRGDVAGLTGDAWLAWLDRDLDRPHFQSGNGRPLIEWPYRAPDFVADESDVVAFVDAVRLRLSTPVEGSA